MQSDDEPVFDVAITDLEEQRTLTSSDRRHSRWRWGIVALLVVALLATGELAWAAQPLLLQHQNGQTRTSSIPGPTPVSPAVFASLAARSLRFPTVRSLAICPVSPVQHTNLDYDGWVAGPGPFYLYLGVVAQHGTASYTPASDWGDGLGWGGTKSFWISRGSFGGPVVVRGKRLDAAGEVRFDTEPTFAIAGADPLRAALLMVIPAQPTVAYQVDGYWYVRFNAPGCYGLQVDWPRGTEWIIFRAVDEPGAG
jgi:hypothetical protein